MEAQSFMELLSGYNLISSETDSHIVQHYVSSLSTFKVVANGSVKDLQPIISSVNECINSGSLNGKLNGLIVLEELVKDHSSHVFTQLVPNYIQQLVPLIRPANAPHPYFEKACEVLSLIIKFSPDYPEASRRITSVTTNLVTNLVACSKSHPTCSKPVARCLLTLQKHYFSACGPAIKHIERFVLENIHPWTGVIEHVDLTSSFALLPQAGGAGRDGIAHKEAWDKLAKRTILSLEQLVENVFVSTTAFIPTVKASEENVLDLPGPNSSLDQLRRGYFYSSQFGILADCLGRLLTSAFPYPKAVRPGMILRLCTRIIAGDLYEHMKGSKKIKSQGTYILLSIYPDIVSATLRIIESLVKSCRQDLILYVPDILRLLVTISQDFRQSSNEISCVVPHDSLREQFYSLVSSTCKILGPNSGIQHAASLIVPVAVADFLPSKSEIRLTTSSGKSKKKQSVENGSDIKSLSKKPSSSPALVISSLEALSNIFEAAGVLLNKAVHKNVQLILIGLCLEIQQQIGSKSWLLESGFSDPKARAAIYSALLKIVVNDHPRWQFPLQYAVQIFQRGSQLLVEASNEVRQICRSGLTACQLITQPRSASLNLDLPIDLEKVNKTLSESMKVHVIYTCSDQQASNSGTHFSKRVGQDDGSSDEEVSEQQPEPKDKVDSISNSHANDPVFRLLSGKQNGGKRKSESVQPLGPGLIDPEEMSEVECEKLMKDVQGFDQRPPIVIPDEVANRFLNDSSKSSKKARVEVMETEANGHDSGPDLAEMLKSFVDKPRDE